MKHLMVNNDLCVISTHKGSITICRDTINFTSIVAALKNNASESEIEELLKTSDVDNCIFKVYKVVGFEKAVVKVIDNDEYYFTDMAKNKTNKYFNKDNTVLLGTYSSHDQVIASWPEYVI